MSSTSFLTTIKWLYFVSSVTACSVAMLLSGRLFIFLTMKIEIYLSDFNECTDEINTDL